MRLLIKNGHIVDPGNRVDGKIHLIVENGKVAGYTTDDKIPCDQILDAEGCIVAPGFVDIHFHEDPADTQGIKTNITLSALHMGVTSALGGNCGINTYDPKSYLDMLDRDGAPINVGLFCGHTYFRNAVGFMDKYSVIDKKSLAMLKNALLEGLSAGCFGISYGIRYVPGITAHELRETARILRGTDKLLTAHIRDDADKVFDSLRELTDIASELELPVQNSHIGSMGGFGQMETLLQQIDAMRGNGLRISSDCYPYDAFSTRIGESTYDEGFLARYQTDYNAIEICSGKYRGQRCTEALFHALRKNEPDTLTIC
jgi:N-acyl-D-amino-acid deacylase